MKLTIQIFRLALLFIMLSVNGQTTTITFKTNGSDSLVVNNPFTKFIGEWNLKDNLWTQNWGNGTETFEILSHHTISTAINTKNSLLQIVDGPQPNGHIFWSYNPVTNKVNHLSSFGELRAGVGEGTISDHGNVELKITFEGEPKNTYRIYNYTWVNADEYHMKSVQYDADDQPTGLFYEGTFVRLLKKPTVKDQIEAILAVLDNHKIPIEEQLKVYDDAVVHMAPNHEVNLGKAELSVYLLEQRQFGWAKMKHDIIEIEDLGRNILMQGKVTGTFYPKTGEKPVEFQTKNLFVFSNDNGVLKIAKVIYNNTPMD